MVIQMKFFLLLTTVLSLIISSDAFSSCVSHSSKSVGSGIYIDVENNCSEDKNINVCLRKDDDQWRGGEKNGKFVRAGRSFRFQFINFGRAGYTYRVRWCSPDGTTRVNNCEVSC